MYGSAVTKVEPFGVDHIPDNERHGKPSSQFFVWFAAGLNFPIILLGFSAVGLGLSFGAAVAAIVVGAGLGSLLMAVMSRMGVRLGCPSRSRPGARSASSVTSCRWRTSTCSPGSAGPP
ncbi:hypothetical protein SVIO_096840 [Streptomyces violaceusniger]|uniref:Cytosine permease n=1 Tax=Streptomyces violaceusniger TaxID=68280 RepID=A0A4D4LBV4_STRVO|nr:hypothetical protein SVIO_096840 [Streptomyces violaceusniger]